MTSCYELEDWASSALNLETLIRYGNSNGRVSHTPPITTVHLLSGILGAENTIPRIPAMCEELLSVSGFRLML